MNVKEFDPLAIIGRGAFGEVRLCKYRETGEIFAVKKMKKSEMKLQSMTQMRKEHKQDMQQKQQKQSKNHQ